MTDNRPVKQLKAYLDKQPAGAALDAESVVNLLSGCWDDLKGSKATKMRADKLGRIERPTWNPPCLEFLIERHGQTVNGSTRATVYRWRVDLDKGTAVIVEEQRRQLSAMDMRLDVKPIAESLAYAIVHGADDPRIVIGKDRAVRLRMGEIIPETNKQTTSARRQRLRRHLSDELRPHGWNELRTNVYHRVEGKAE